MPPPALMTSVPVQVMPFWSLNVTPSGTVTTTPSAVESTGFASQARPAHQPLSAPTKTPAPPARMTSVPWWSVKGPGAVNAARGGIVALEAETVMPPPVSGSFSGRTTASPAAGTPAVPTAFVQLQPSPAANQS